MTKLVDIANYFNNYFNSKVNKLRNVMEPTDNRQSYDVIKEKIMRDKSCQFEFTKVTVDYVKKLLTGCKDKPPGVDNVDGKLLKIVAHLIATPICHVFNLSLVKCIYPKDWKIAKITPLSKNVSAPFSGPNCRPISLLPTLSKLMERIVYEQIQCYFSVNDLNTDFQHAYKKGHSTETALMQMTDNKEIKEKA